MREKPFSMSLAVMLACLVLLVALVAGGGMLLLHRLHSQYVHATATRAVLAEGGRIAAYLARQPVVVNETAAEQNWSDFSKLIRSLHMLEGGLQYVSVTRGDMIVFQEHTPGLAADDAPPAQDLPEQVPADVRVERKVIEIGGEDVPVVVFRSRADVPGRDAVGVEVAIRRESVSREQTAGATAVASMFRLSLFTIVLCFGVCLVLLVWLTRREVRREERRRAEEHLAFSGVLANGIVHDFRNPMSSLHLDLQMLRRETEKGAAARLDRTHTLAARAARTLERMDKVFQSFLYLARPDREEGEEPVDLRRSVRESVDMLRPRFEEKDVALDVRLPETPVRASVLSFSIRRALVNVLTNAVEFSAAGQTVRVALSRHGREAVLDVMDEGPGIAPRERDRVFKMCVSSRPGGTGLGLFLAKAAVER